MNDKLSKLKDKVDPELLDVLEDQEQRLAALEKPKEAEHAKGAAGGGMWAGRPEGGMFGNRPSDGP